MSDVAPNRPNPAITQDQIVELISKAGCPGFTASHLEADIASGAPANGDGTINWLNYAAWLVTQQPD